MKKRFITLLMALLVVVSMLTACKPKKTETIYSQNTNEVRGSYILFQTEDAQIYLNFLEEFDEEKYEIVDISTSMYVGTNQSAEFYMVTYKVVGE